MALNVAVSMLPQATKSIECWLISVKQQHLKNIVGDSKEIISISVAFKMYGVVNNDF